MKDRAFPTGEAKRKDKDAREKTCNLYKNNGKGLA